jgi:hypothetical protein
MFSQILSSLTLIKSRMQIKMDRGSTLWWWRQGLRTRPSKWGWTLGIFLVRRRHGTKVNDSNGVPPLLQTETDVVRRDAGSRMEHVCRELHGGWGKAACSRPVHMEKWQNRAVESSSGLAWTKCWLFRLKEMKMSIIFWGWLDAQLRACSCRVRTTPEKFLHTDTTLL